MTTDFIANVQAKLAALGNTDTEVAASLAKAGAYGRRGSATADPVARYLEGLGLGITRVHALPQVCIVFTIDGAFHIDTPEPVGQLMRRFDVGGFDALLEPEAGEVRA
jgi:hypothetical protein